MRKVIIFAVAVLVPIIAVPAVAEEPILDYWNTVNDITYRFSEGLQDAQPYLEWTDTKDQQVRDDIIWDLEVVVNDLGKIKAEFDSLAVPPGFESSHSLISNSLELYLTGLSRVGQGIQMNYTNVFNGGITDISTAADFMDQGYYSLSEDMTAAGYIVE